MNGTIPVPAKGDGLKATWGADVANGLNALMPMSPSGMLVREGAGGVGCEPLPKNQRDRKGASVTTPWTFAVNVTNAGQANETRSGGWRNCRMQIGYDAAIDETEGGHYAGTQGELNVNGVYYAEVDVAAKTWDLKVVATNNTNGKVSRSLVPASDFTNNKVNVFIGTVKDNVCTYTIGCIPVVYIYV